MVLIYGSLIRNKIIFQEFKGWLLL